MIHALLLALLATPRAETTGAPSVPLPVRELRACRDARLAVGIPLEAPAGVLSEIVRIDVVTSLRAERPLGLAYSLRNGREFFGFASDVLDDPVAAAAADEFIKKATLGATAPAMDDLGGYSVAPIVIDASRLPALGITRRNCASIRVL